MVEPPEGGPGHDQARGTGGNGAVELGQGLVVVGGRPPEHGVALGEGAGVPPDRVVDAPLVLVDEGDGVPCDQGLDVDGRQFAT
jgi:hypothetical protein